MKFVRKLLPCAFLLVSLLSYSQITVQFIPAVHGQNLQSLAMTRFTNNSRSAAHVTLSIKITEAKSGTVLQVKTPNFLLPQGVSTVDRAAFAKASFSFSENPIGRTIRQSGSIMEGDYEYCFVFDVLDSKDPTISPIYEQCFTYQLQPLTPLLLLVPVDADVLCNKRPGFTWQPPMPLPPTARFRLLLVELKDAQEPVEAIAYNPPIINRPEIPINTLAFPVNLPELVEGHRYAWQVTLYSGGIIIKKSEIWTFTVKCTDQTKQPVTESYRELKETAEGDFYVTKDVLRFSLYNPYTDGPLSYTIECLSNPKQRIRSLPTLRFAPGLNKYDIDLTENNSFKSGQEYLLKVFLPNNRQQVLRFIYKTEL